MKQSSAWRAVCALEELLPDCGAAALVDGRQIAIFRVGDALYALDNYDPNGGANVLARGLVGDVRGEPVVASPLYKHHFSLATGRCLEDPLQSVRAYPARVIAGVVWVKLDPRPVAGKRRLVVIGNGMAGTRMLEELIDLAPGLYDITVFGAEPHPAYNRVLLSAVLAGERQATDIMTNSFEWYRQQGISLHAGDPAVTIDRARSVVRAASGFEAPFDRLVLATGSDPIVLPVPGVDLDGVVTFRDLQDVDTMVEAASTQRRAVVIGGGLLGLEAANGLRKRGMDVTVVHICDRLMERQLDRPAAVLLKESLEERGLKFCMPAQTVAILGNVADVATGVRLSDGREVAADVVVMAVGIRPNVALARAAGLRCERGVLVGDTMQTYDPRIYAVGECVQHRNRTYGLVAPLFEQARACARQLAESSVGRFAGSILSTQLKVSGIDLFSVGDFLASPDSETLVFTDPRRGIYKRVVVERNRLRGAVLYGDVSDSAWYLELMSRDRDITSLRETLLFGAVRT